MKSSLGFTGLVEFAPTFIPNPRITHALFDFDGTLSIIREGWPVVMLAMFQEMLPKAEGDNPSMIRQMLFDDMMSLNGKQTIYQMMKFAERVTERGGTPQEPLAYKHEYLRRLNEKIAARIEGISDRTINRADYIVHGAEELLESLKARGIQLYLASGTDEQFVKAEVRLLGLEHFFEGRIYGAKDDYKQFSKKMIIDRIISENKIAGSQLLAFGDGYVEIQNTKDAGGMAVAVASDEANNGSGRVDEWKRTRLLSVGADIVIPDYRDAGPLLARIFGDA